MGNKNELAIALPPAAAYNKLAREIKDGLAETKEMNKRFLEDFEERAFAFSDALQDVKVAIGQIKVLTFANGGDKTGKAFGWCSDQLIAASNAFNRQVKSMATNPFAQIDGDAVNDLAQECLALCSLANAYVLAKDVDRPAFQRQMATAIAEAEPHIATLIKSRKPKKEEVRILAEMIDDQLKQGKSWKAALYHIQEHNQTLYKTYFNQPTMESKVNFAKSLLRSL